METPSYVAEDARLEEDAESSKLELTKHRWHYTLNPNGPKMPIRAYAKEVARPFTTIRNHAKAYEMWLSSDRAGDHTIDDLIFRANLGTEKEAAVDAVAAVTGSSPTVVGRHKSDEVKAVHNEARKRAERKGTTVEEEVHHVAERREMGRKAAARQAEEKRKAHTVRYIMVDGAIANAVRELRNAMTEASGVEFTDEERELLEDSIARLRGVLALIEVELTGEQSVIDWDEELAKLTE